MRVPIGVRGGGVWGPVQVGGGGWGVPVAKKKKRDKGKGLGTVAGGGTGRGTGKSMRTRLSRLPFGKLPFSLSQFKEQTK